jgi:MFS family permease
MSRLGLFFGFTDASDEAMYLAKVLFAILPFANFIFMMGTTFHTIFVAEALGDGDYILGLGLLGSLIVIQMAVQTSLDYFSGAIGDWIGQRWVIASGNFCYGVSFIMLSFVTSSSPFLYLVAIFALNGFASSQISGAWGAWFDNNYRVAMPSDPERKQYGVFWGRMGMVTQIAATVSLIPGSILGVIYGRPWVFQFQGIGAIIFAILVIRFIRDFPEVEEMREERPTMSEYVSLLKDGVCFLVRNPYVGFITVGSMLAVSTITVWGELILFPLYFSYLITQVAVASYRTFIFIPNVFAQERSGVWSQKFEPKKWIPIFRVLQACGFIFYVVIALMMTFFPPMTNGGEFLVIMLPFTEISILEIPISNIIPVIILAITFTVTLFFGGFAEILTQRELMDVIPDRIRNSVYSLSPTILFIFAMPQIGIFGWLIPVIGFPTTLFLIGLISLVGVFIIRHGLSLPKPVSITHEEKATEDTIEVAPSDTLTDDKIEEVLIEPAEILE